MLSEYGIPNNLVYKILKENVGVEFLGKTSGDKKGLLDIRPNFQDKDLYSKYDFLDKLKNLRPDLDIEKINDYDLSLLGFKEADNLVFPLKYKNVEDYLINLLNE